MDKTVKVKVQNAADDYRLSPESIYHFIEENWVTPIDPINLFLDDDDLTRIQLIVELQEGFGVNDEGIPIILHLIDQLNHLHLKFIGKTEYSRD